jgi:tripeptide aminopeptidase
MSVSTYCSSHWIRLGAITAPALVILLACDRGDAFHVGTLDVPQQFAVTPIEDRYRQEVSFLIGLPEVHLTLKHIEATDALTVQDQIGLSQIPAPPFGEARRAERYAQLLASYGADSVWTDLEGNVIALRRGQSGDRRVALTAHLDTVFPEDTEFSLRIVGDTILLPGISDNGRGIATVAAVLRTVAAVGVRTEADLLFIGTVGETGLGDLRGVRELFSERGPGIDAFIAVDASGDRHVVHKGLGSRRYRITFRGPGGHSWRAFGLGNPQHALGEAIFRFDKEASLLVTPETRDTYNVGRIGGGTSVNAVPMEAWMEVDLRSEDPGQLAALDSLLNHLVMQALMEHNARRTRGDSLTLEFVKVGDRPSGELPPSLPLIQRARAVTEYFGNTPSLERSSTDSNIPISMGIPAFTTGGGGVGINHHATTEAWVNDNGFRGIQRVALILLAEAGIAEGT